MSPARVYYGWVVVAALCVTETVTWGIVYYGYPVFLRPMEEALGGRDRPAGACSLVGSSRLTARLSGRRSCSSACRGR